MVGSVPSVVYLLPLMLSSKPGSLLTVLECNHVGTGLGNVCLPLLFGLLWPAFVGFWARVSMVLLSALRKMPVQSRVKQRSVADPLIPLVLSISYSFA